MNSRHIQFYLTAESPCSYFDDRMSCNLVPDPNLRLNMPVYNQLIQHGFRRSGGYTYRPHCSDCQSCIACRIPIAEFTPNRSQRRCLKLNRQLQLAAVPAAFTEEYFDLYRRYLDSRHTDGSMADPEKEDFKQFLYSKWSETAFLEFRLDGRLIAVAVTDIASDGVSAVYSFFDPEMSKHSLGTYCVLKQLDYAKLLGLDYIYLGYWIEDHPKMHYKVNFRPLQVYRDEQWQTYSEKIKA